MNRKGLWTACFVGLTWALVTPCSDALAAPSVDEIYRILEERGISFDQEKADTLAVRGLIKAVDSRARIVPGDQEKSVQDPEPVAAAEDWPEGVCYLRLNGLYEGSEKGIGKCLQQWGKAGKSGVLIDLRGAGGDSLAAVDRIAGYFADADALLYEIRDGRDQVLETHEPEVPGVKDVARTMPWVVLVDRNTHDESELLAAVMKGRRGILLVGTRTRGDAGRRELVPLAEDLKLYIATSWRVLPGGKRYDRTGIQPDAVMSGKGKPSGAALPERDSSGRAMTERARQARALSEKVKDDLVLQRGMDILLALKVLAGDEVAEDQDDGD